MERRVWCAIAGQDRILHVDATNCDIVYDLKKAAVDLSKIKIPYPRVDIWKVKEPHKWPAADASSSKAISNDVDDLRMIAELLYPQTKLGTICIEGAGTIEFIMKINSRRKSFPSISVPERRIWCAIADQGQILQVDIAKCKDLAGLKRAIARDADLSTDHLDVWKVKEPQEWPVDDGARKRNLPSDIKGLEEIAERLEVEMPPINDTFFDDTIRKEHIYLFVQDSEDISTQTSSSKYMAWCGVPGRTRMFQVDVGKYKTRTVYALRDEVLRKSGFKTQDCQLWKIKDPQLWPIKGRSPAVEFRIADAFLNTISEQLDRHTPVAEVFSEPLRENSLHLLLIIIDESPFGSEKQSLTSSLDSPPSGVRERVLWCAVAGRNEVIRVDSGSCMYGADLKDAVLEQGRFGLVCSQVAIWKVKEPHKWAVRNIVIGSAKVPSEREQLREIADNFYSHLVVDEQFAQSTCSEWTELILEIVFELDSSTSSSSSSSSTSRSDPFSERPDIQEALKELGFRDDVFQDMDRWHVGDVFTTNGERYVAKYLRPNRCDEIKVLKYLSQFDSPQNHAPSSFISQDLQDGALILTRYYGVPVRKYAHLSRDLLLIVRQFLEGVVFLHSKRVVHMDLKLSHIIIDDSKRLWIIDFDLSEILENDEETVSGFRGTRGCTAPEVGRNAYDPILADTWAAGNVVSELCALCPLHEARDFLVDLCTRLMDRDPSARLSLHDAYNVVLNYKLNDFEGESPERFGESH